MINSFKGRQVVVGKRYEVYRNLHKGAFSIKSRQEGVVAHGDNFFLKDVLFSVNEKGRQRVIAERSKNVHACISGELIKFTIDESNDLREIYYNPYKHGYFYYKDNGEKVDFVDLIIAKDNKVYEILNLS